MYPRPRARGPGNPIRVVDPDDLAEACHRVWRENKSAAVAVLSGPREWLRMRRDPRMRPYSRFWPGGEETFAGIPVVIARTAGRPEVMATQQDLEDALLGREEER